MTSLKKFIPPTIKKNLRASIKFAKYNWRRLAIRAPVSRNQPIKIILGAAETWQKDWYSTNEIWLDIARADHWENVFQGKKIVQKAVAEHVFEHLTPDQTRSALKNIYDHMPSGGRLRIAVPDGYHPDPEYKRHVNINGIGDDAADHKQLLNVDQLSLFLSEAGFKPVHIEGYDNTGRLITQPYSSEDGFIWRSRAHKVPSAKTWDFPDAHTSLIVDGLKP